MGARGIEALKRYWRERRGASAVEMALVLPAVLFLALGGSNLVLVLYAVVSLNSATEAGARWASMQTNDGSAPAACSTPTSGSPCAIASSVYHGPGLGSLAFTFTPNDTTITCGGNSNVVQASGVYHLYYGIGRLSMTLNTQSCFP